MPPEGQLPVLQGFDLDGHHAIARNQVYPTRMCEWLARIASHSVHLATAQSGLAYSFDLCDLGFFRHAASLSLATVSMQADNAPWNPFRVWPPRFHC